MEMVQQQEASSCYSPVAFRALSRAPWDSCCGTLVEDLILVYHKGAIYPLFCLHKQLVYACAPVLLSQNLANSALHYTQSNFFL